MVLLSVRSTLETIVRLQEILEKDFGYCSHAHWSSEFSTEDGAIVLNMGSNKASEALVKMMSVVENFPVEITTRGDLLQCDGIEDLCTALYSVLVRSGLNQYSVMDIMISGHSRLVLVPVSQPVKSLKAAFDEFRRDKR